MYSFCVAAQDPLLQLAEYKLSNAYAGTFDEKNGDSDEDEPDPDSFAFGCGLKNGDPDEDEPDPDSFAFDYGDLDEFELDPDSFANDCDPSLRRVIDQMCRSGEVDDHGDTFACATTLDLGHPVFGEVRNDWGDDADIFAFMLSELRTVEIATSGRIDIFGGLYDRSGQRLAADDDGGSGDRFRLVKTLVPGWYFVRVEGRHSSEGDYRLHVDVLSQ